MASSVFIGWFGGGAPWSWSGTTATLTGNLTVTGTLTAATISLTSSTAPNVKSSGGTTMRVGTADNNGFVLVTNDQDRWQISNVGNITDQGTSSIRLNGGLGIAVANTATGTLGMTEIATPSAPAADGVLLFAKDNGAGKTQLMALFASGAAQQVAIQP